jgi:hypothetical protein
MDSTTIIKQTSRIVVRSWLKSDLQEWMLLSQDEGLNKFSLSGYRMNDAKIAEAFMVKAMAFFDWCVPNISSRSTENDWDLWS